MQLSLTIARSDWSPQLPLLSVSQLPPQRPCTEKQISQLAANLELPHETACLPASQSVQVSKPALEEVYLPLSQASQEVLPMDSVYLPREQSSQDELEGAELNFPRVQLEQTENPTSVLVKVPGLQLAQFERPVEAA